MVTFYRVKPYHVLTENSSDKDLPIAFGALGLFNPIISHKTK